MLNIVRVVNTSTKPIKLNYGRDIYNIEGKKSVLVPFEAAAYWLGDPGLHDVRPGDGTRRDFYDRKRAFWSFALGNDGEAEWENKRPTLEVYTADDANDRVYMLLDDPSGELGNPALRVSSQPADAAAMQAQLAQLEAQIAHLLAQQNATSNPAVDAPPSPDIPDGPSAHQEVTVPVASDDSTAKPDTPQQVSQGQRRRGN